MEQILFVVLIGIVGLARLLVQIAENKKKSEAPKPGSAAGNLPAGPTPARTEEERVRKFFEALGVPTTATPPARVPPRTVTPRKPRQKPLIDPFPMPRSGGLPMLTVPTASQVPAVEVAPEAVSERLRNVATRPSAPVKFEVRDVSELVESVLHPAELSQSPSRNAVARLLTGEGLREAIIVREILGPPRSMQPFSHRG